MKSTCSMAAGSTEWKAIKPDGSLVAPGTAGTLKVDLKTAGGAPQIGISLTNVSSGDQWPSLPFKDLAAASGVSIPKILIAMGMFPESSATYGGDRFYARNDGERLPFRGSGFDHTSSAGASAVNLDCPRSSVNVHVGFRSAYAELQTED